MTSTHQATPPCFGSFRVCLALLFALPVQSAPAVDEDSLLPPVGLDVIRIVEAAGRERLVSGSIEDIQGQTLTFRRGEGGQVQFLRITDVLELQFLRSVQWNDGLQARRAGHLRRALGLFDEALRHESRSWAWVELQAIAAKTLIQLGQRREALDRLLKIEERDQRSRHLGLAPIVWDERIPRTDRLMMNSAELRDESTLVQLAAASSLLHEGLYHAKARSVLEKLRRTSHGPIGDLAETQLWRLPLLSVAGNNQPLVVWQDRLRMLRAETRHGPALVLGRCLQEQNDHDAAVVPLLWCALMSPTDPALAAVSHVEAIRSHKLTGRTQQHQMLTQEFHQKFGADHFALQWLKPAD